MCLAWTWITHSIRDFSLPGTQIQRVRVRDRHRERSACDREGEIGGCSGNKARTARNMTLKSSSAVERRSWSDSSNIFHASFVLEYVCGILCENWFYSHYVNFYHTFPFLSYCHLHPLVLLHLNVIEFMSSPFLPPSAKWQSPIVTQFGEKIHVSYVTSKCEVDNYI